jgi:hypothetical protein
VERSIVRHRVQIAQTHSPAHWSVYTATVTEILIMEDEFLRHCLPLQRGDLPDGSIGQRWRGFRDGVWWAGPSWQDCLLVMPHILVAGQPLNVCPYVYAPAELARFQDWLHRTYLPEHLPQYLGLKFRPLREPLAVASAADYACRELTGHPARLPEPTRRQLALAGGRVRVGERQLPGMHQRELFSE